MHNIALIFLFIIIWFVGLFSGKMVIYPLNSRQQGEETGGKIRNPWALYFFRETWGGGLDKSPAPL